VHDLEASTHRKVAAQVVIEVLLELDQLLRVEALGRLEEPSGMFPSV
jgi:hypothetical protein